MLRLSARKSNSSMRVSTQFTWSSAGERPETIARRTIALGFIGLKNNQVKSLSGCARVLGAIEVDVGGGGPSRLELRNNKRRRDERNVVEAFRDLSR